MKQQYLDERELNRRRNRTMTRYQDLASRTEVPKETILVRLSISQLRLIHAVIGLAGEVGELATALEREVFYGQDRDPVNLSEELGDCQWYEAMLANVIDVDMDDVRAANIAKLRNRFPTKFTEHDAKEENRDREEEARIVARDTGDESIHAQAEIDTVEEVLVGQVTYDNLCSHCKTPLSDECAKRIVKNSTAIQCPECRCMLTSVARGHRLAQG